MWTRTYCRARGKLFEWGEGTERKESKILSGQKSQMEAREMPLCLIAPG